MGSELDASDADRRLQAVGETDDRDQRLELLAAGLRRDRQELATFMEVLATKLEALLPGATKVERRRQGLRGGTAVRRITVSGGGEVLELEGVAGHAATPSAARARISGGIVLKREQLGIDEWLSALIELVQREVRDSDTARRALSSILLDSE